MYPSPKPDIGNDRVPVENAAAGFFAGTQARTFYEMTLAAGASLYVMMYRPINININGFKLTVLAGNVRCEVYRNSVPSGTWATNLPVIPKNEMTSRPRPLYVPKCSIKTGGTFTGGTLYDILDVSTSSAQPQATAITADSIDNLGAPENSTGYYKFTNSGNGTSRGIWSMWWEELS